MKINIQSSIINKIFFIVCIQGLLGLQTAYAAIYYVSPSGNDANSGNLLSTPWKTITKAANTLVAGDTVYIRAGTYKEQVTPKNSGNAISGYITYKAYTGEIATVDASNGLNWSWNGVFDLDKRSYLEISGLRIINSNGFGVFMRDSTNMRILNNYTDNTTKSGIYANTSRNIMIDKNEVVNANMGGEGHQESITLCTVDNATVSNNTLHGGRMEGIDAKCNTTNTRIFGNTTYNMARQGIYVDSYSNTPRNIQIYNNVISGPNGNTFGAGASGIIIGAENGNLVDGVQIYNNIIYNAGSNGIQLDWYRNPGYPEPQYKNISIVNNTIYNSGTTTSWGGGIDIQASTVQNIIIRNNIISKNRAFPIRVVASIPSANITISNNLIDRSPYQQAGGVRDGTAAVITNPLFSNVAGNDFHLQSTSPAINAGLSGGAPSFDFELKGRPQGGQIDIGAFEYDSSNTPRVTPPVTPPVTPTVSIPDVILTSLSYANGIFKCTVKNQGTAATPAGVAIGVAYFVNGAYRTWGHVTSPLAAGASVAIGTDGAPYTIPSRTYKVTAWVDDPNRFAESDETNNKL